MCFGQGDTAWVEDIDRVLQDCRGVSSTCREECHRGKCWSVVSVLDGCFKFHEAEGVADDGIGLKKTGKRRTECDIMSRE